MGGSTTNHFNGTCHVPPQQFLNHQTRLFRQEIFEKWWFGSGLYIFPIYCESSVFALTKGIQPEQDIQNFSWKGNIYAPTKGVYKLCTNFWILSESSFAWRRTSGFLFFKVDVRKELLLIKLVLLDVACLIPSMPYLHHHALEKVLEQQQ